MFGDGEERCVAPGDQRVVSAGPEELIEAVDEGLYTLAGIRQDNALGACARPVSRRAPASANGADPVARTREPAAGAERRALLGVGDDDAGAQWLPPPGSCSLETVTAPGAMSSKSLW
jgi:hypothetical protein